MKRKPQRLGADPVGPPAKTRIDLKKKHVLFRGDCMDFIHALPNDCADLVVSSPPYCMGKEYETSHDPADFLLQHQKLIPELQRILKPGGSMCWQVGNHVANGVVTPLDYLVLKVCYENSGLILRNRIVWTFGHGLHCQNRFSGRYETILWFTKVGADYKFNLDAVRVKQKYPGKRGYKGPLKGQFTGNPMGKNPGDVWEIPNVKGNHIEKTQHPCQFPIALVQRLILALTNPGDVVFDPFLGSGASACAAELEGRRCFGSELNIDYYKLAVSRLNLAENGQLNFRPHNKPVFTPDPRTKVAQDPFSTTQEHEIKKAS